MAVQAPAASLTERSVVDLARAIRTDETSSRDVVEAHIELLERAFGGWVPPTPPTGLERR